MITAKECYSRYIERRNVLMTERIGQHLKKIEEYIVEDCEIRTSFTYYFEEPKIDSASVDSIVESLESEGFKVQKFRLENERDYSLTISWDFGNK